MALRDDDLHSPALFIPATRATRLARAPISSWIDGGAPWFLKGSPASARGRGGSHALKADSSVGNFGRVGHWVEGITVGRRVAGLGAPRHAALINSGMTFVGPMVPFFKQSRGPFQRNAQHGRDMGSCPHLLLVRTTFYAVTGTYAAGSSFHGKPGHAKASFGIREFRGRLICRRSGCETAV